MGQFLKKQYVNTERDYSVQMEVKEKQWNDEKASSVELETKPM